MKKYFHNKTYQGASPSERFFDLYIANSRMFHPSLFSRFSNRARGSAAAQSASVANSAARSGENSNSKGKQERLQTFAPREVLVEKSDEKNLLLTLGCRSSWSARPSERIPSNDLIRWKSTGVGALCSPTIVIIFSDAGTTQLGNPVRVQSVAKRGSSTL